MAELAVQAHVGAERDEEARELVVAVVREHAPSLLRTARRHSLCDDDANDAYQRALEIFLRRATDLRRATIVQWLDTVVKHEAQAIRRARQSSVGREDVDLDAHEAARLPDDDERVLRFDRLHRSAEALAGLKPQEVSALWLKAQGHSYQEIAEDQGWSHTKTNRLISEGRRAFLARYAGIESGAECRRWAPVLSAIVDGEVTPRDRAAVRPHLRHCPACRATVRELRLAGPRLAGLWPAGLVGARIEPEDTGGRTVGLITRVWEALAAGLQERAAGSIVKLQAAADTASAAKVAAVASAAAALAGGGAVTARETHVFSGSSQPAHVHRIANPRAAAAARAPALPVAGQVARVAARPTTVRRRAAPDGHRGRPRRSSSPAGPDRSGGEFGVESDAGGGVVEPAGSPAAPVASAAGQVAASAASTPAATSKPGDFGVEGP